MKLEERYGGVHHYLEAGGRNLILKRATYKCAIITIITTISHLTEEAEVLIQASLSKHIRQDGHACPFYVVVGKPNTLSPSHTTAIDGALLDSLHRI